jgi:protein-tyrosine-phosphatase
LSSAPVTILTVCTHNRTRSVMMAAFLESQLAGRPGTERLTVRSSGFATPGLPPIDAAVAAMARRGLDVSRHRSTPTTVELVEDADLIVAAERDHVVKIASRLPAAFGRSATLPEWLARATAVDAPRSDGVAAWAVALTTGRTAADYLRDPVEEVADPTGSSGRAFDAAVADLERRCAELTALIAPVLAP